VGLPLAIAVAFRDHFLANRDRASSLGGELLEQVRRVRGRTRRPVVLIGHSLGARLIVSGFEQEPDLAKRLGISDVVLLGGAIGSHSEAIAAVKQCTQNRVWNFWNKGDKALMVKFHTIDRERNVGHREVGSPNRKFRNHWFDAGDMLGHGYPERLHDILEQIRRARGAREGLYLEGLPSWLADGQRGEVFDVECPYCEAKRRVSDGEEVKCEDCGCEYEYRVEDDTCYYTEEPIWVDCPRCFGESGILVQESAAYECPDCGRTTEFERAGSELTFTSDGIFEAECPNCGERLLCKDGDDDPCSSCGIEFVYDADTNGTRYKIEPKEVQCPKCDGEEGITVQGDGFYQCPDCRRYTEFFRKKDLVLYE
jgi:pimeloyl-ACP methyl ester carboxylesterase/DNA-directed RNA polymerase subunit RPC12/RpoP